MSEHALDRTILLLQRDYFPSLTRPVALEVLSTIRARLVCDDSSAHSPAGQTAMTTVAWTLAAMGLPCALDIPVVEVRGQPPLRPGLITDELSRLGWSASHHGADLTIALGRAPSRGRTVRIVGGEYEARISPDGAGSPWVGTAPFGGLLAGVLAGSAALRLVVERLAVALGEPVPALLPTAGAVCLPPMRLGPVELRRVDVVSAGAITNSALFALLRCPAVSGALRIFDDDIAEVTNLNRYPLLVRDDLGRPKARLLEQYGTPLLRIRGEVEQFTAARNQLPLADSVLVGVDDIPSRWVAQRHAPGWLHVAATSHFEVMSSAHRAGGPCAGCAHPRDDDQPGPIPTISFVSLLAGTLQAWSLPAHASTLDVPSWYSWALNAGGPHGLKQLELARNPRCPVCRAVA